MMRMRSSLEIKTPAQLDLMRKAGLIVAEALAAVSAQVGDGVTTAQLNSIAEAVIRRHNALPSFLGYHGYPAVICTSVNSEVVHGIPNDKPLRDGDIISIDCGAYILDSRGTQWHGDSAVTVIVGGDSAATQEDLALSAVTRDSMWAGLAAAQVGARLTDIGAAIEAVVRKAPHYYGILEEYTGHGIGTAMHLAPAVENYGPGGRGPMLKPGLALAIEPMLTFGSADTDVLADQWTVVTSDASRAAHWEHSVAITDEGPWVLTAPDGGAAAFARMGIASPASARG